MGQKYYARARAATLASCVIAVFATAYAEVYEYDGVLPEVSGNEFTSNTIPTWVTDPTRWTGTVSIKNVDVTDFTVNPYGNESSVVRLSGVSGWLRAPGNYAFTNTVPVELVGTLTINNGNSANDSNPNRCTVFKKLSGSGSISADENANKVVVVIQDASEFTGNIGLNDKLIVFGDAMPSYADNNKYEGMTGSIWVMADAKVTNRGFWWAVGGIKVYGELRAAGLGKFGGGTSITTSDTGVFTLIDSDNTRDEAVDYARITGTGTLRYADVSGKWRTLSAVNFPTGMICENNLSEGLILTTQGENTIGSLAGSGSMRSDWGGSKNVASRTLKILQAKDTEYSGVFHSDDRISTVTVAPGATSAGTLTLSGTQTVSNDLVVESGAKVNITGAWQGTTTVAGTLGGTGTITGGLTLSDGATLNVVDFDNPLKVTGDFSATGTIEVHLPAGADLSHLKTILSATGTINAGSATFLVTEIGGEDQNPAHYSVKTGKKRLFVMGHHGNRVIFR